MTLTPAFCSRCGAPLAPRALDHDDRPRLACSADGCGYVFYDNPTPVVAAVVEHEGDVLLVQNQGWPDTWFGLVTGFLERGESPTEGALRELSEELGLEGEVVGLIGAYSFPMMNQVIIAYHVRARGVVALGPELAAYKRVAPHKLRPWPMGTGEAVRDWLAARAQAAQAARGLGEGGAE
jgi:ADP-ribose pyrophosphatase YjhB (NUDIX family)